MVAINTADDSGDLINGLKEFVMVDLLFASPLMACSDHSYHMLDPSSFTGFSYV
jgi:hypothetical protein